MAGPSITPLSIYQDEIARGNLASDPDQLQVVRELDGLHHALLEQADAPRMRRVFKRRPPPLTGFYIWGSVGTGKTLVMDLFFQALPQDLGQRIHFHRFMKMIHDERADMGNRRDPLAIIATDLADRHRVLCLDEFSVTDITDAMILSGLLENMFERGMVLVTTSNTEPDELYRDGLQRARFLPAIELIKTHTRVLEMNRGMDYRMDFLKDDAIFHTPLDAAAEAALENCFNHLAGRMAGDARNISVFGREVAVRAAGDRVAWFEFDELCRGERSRMDYIDIAGRYHTVLISNLERMDDVDNNAARRFIELVDEFYDRNVKLIVSSAVAPDDLYAGRRLAEPFQRTASRLNEMSAREYLARPHLGPGPSREPGESTNPSDEDVR